MTELAAWPCDVVLNGVVGSLGPGADAGGAARRADPRPGQQGVAGRRRPAGEGRGDAAGADRPGRLRALGAGAVPARRRPAARCGGWCVTASGGPFRGRRRDELAEVTPAQALAHPTWNMGPVVTINSATMVNKALEVIEAHELFDVPYADIEVDGAPAVGDPLDGRVHRRLDPRPGQPAGHAAADRARRSAGRTGCPTPPPAVDWTTAHTWEFLPLDDAAFPAVRWPRPPARPGAAGRRSTTPPTRSAWPRSSPAGCRSSASSTPCERVLEEAPDFAEPGTVEDVLAAESWARAHAPGDHRGVGGRSLMAYLLGVVLFALAILISVSLHEAGHMLTAKAFGMKVTRYFVGFGPTLWSFRRGETEYGLKGIPLGGFCKIVGMTPQDDDVEPGRRAARDVALPGVEADDRDVRRLDHPLRARPGRALDHRGLRRPAQPGLPDHRRRRHRPEPAVVAARAVRGAARTRPAPCTAGDPASPATQAGSCATATGSPRSTARRSPPAATCSTRPRPRRPARRTIAYVRDGSRRTTSRRPRRRASARRWTTRRAPPRRSPRSASALRPSRHRSDRRTARSRRSAPPPTSPARWPCGTAHAIAAHPAEGPRPVERDHRRRAGHRTPRSAWSAPAGSAARPWRTTPGMVFFMLFVVAELLHRRVQPAAAAAAGRRPHRHRLVRAGPLLALRPDRPAPTRAGSTTSS